MAQYQPLQVSFWYTSQVVTAIQMNTLSQDIYAKFQALTENVVPCILNIQGSIPAISGGSTTIPAGFFRFPDVTYSFMIDNPSIFGYAPGNTVSGISGNGWIVARYVISSISTNQTNYYFPTTYVFTSSSPLTTDCIVAVVTAGVITSYGTFYINTAATNIETAAATSTAVALTPANIPSIFGYQWWSVFNSQFTLPSTPYTVSADQFLIAFNNITLASPATIIFDAFSNSFPMGYVAAVFDNENVGQQITINLIDTSNFTTSIAGQQSEGFYVVQFDGDHWVINYLQAQYNYSTFVNINSFPNSLSATSTNQEIPGTMGNLIIKSGQASIPNTAGNVVVTYPSAFPTACVSATSTINGAVASTYIVANAYLTATPLVTLDINLNNTNTTGSPILVGWIAIGY
jgi:hypothetical protein